MSIRYANSMRLATSHPIHVSTIPNIANSMLSASRCNLKNSLSWTLRELLAWSELVLEPDIAETFGERE